MLNGKDFQGRRPRAWKASYANAQTFGPRRAISAKFHAGKRASGQLYKCATNQALGPCTPIYEFVRGAGI
jgi:hypothetical protein